MAGRPTIFTPELAADICKRMTETYTATLPDGTQELRRGRSLKSVCKDADMPEERTVYYWLGSKSFYNADSERAKHLEEFFQQYTHATEVRADMMFEDIVDIADDESKDLIIGMKGFMPNHAAVKRSELRMKARSDAIERMAPKKYGKKVQQQITDADGNNLPAITFVPTTTIPDMPEELAKIINNVSGTTEGN